MNVNIGGDRTDQTPTAGSCGASALSYSAANQITNPGFSYDASGNLTHDASHGYTYDAESRITQVDGGGTAAYIYDAEGRRVTKTTSAGWRDYLYGADGSVLAEIIPAGWNVGYVYLNGGLIAQYSNSTTYFMHRDHLGSTRLMTEVNGTPYESLDYLPFGEQMVNDTGTTHKFDGHERDAESGLDDFGARYYSSSLGRFISSDWSAVPVAVPYANLSNPQTLNLYALVRDNPVTFADLDGHYLMPLDSGAGEGETGGDPFGPSPGALATIGALSSDSEQSYYAYANMVDNTEKQADDKAQQQKVDNETADKTTVGNLSKVLTNEIGSLSTSKGGDPKELENGADALANALINNANKAKPNEVAPDTGTASPQLAKAMRDAYTNRANGGADPVHGRTFYGTSHIPPDRLHSRPIGNGRQTVFAHFGPFDLLPFFGPIIM